MKLVSITGPDDPRLRELYEGIYLAEFAAQREPFEAWQRALAGEVPYAFAVRVALDASGRVIGGIAFEHYPASGCGLLTYLVVAPPARALGIGRALLEDAVHALHGAGASLVLGEVNDPRVHGPSAWPRLARFQRWGARVLGVRYVQPALGEGLARDRGLLLIAFPPLPSRISGMQVRAFVEELYGVTEGGAPDREVEIGDEVPFEERGKPPP
ncbi:MAG: GNAT family N-acetyltransferase [Kofleriaceae bacterium]|nr:GNAT family N-acetyltransferase [Kofleriaceae bacterium]